MTLYRNLYSKEFLSLLMIQNMHVLLKILMLLTDIEVVLDFFLFTTFFVECDLHNQ